MILFLTLVVASHAANTKTRLFCHHLCDETKMRAFSVIKTTKYENFFLVESKKCVKITNHNAKEIDFERKGVQDSWAKMRNFFPSIFLRFLLNVRLFSKKNAHKYCLNVRMSFSHDSITIWQFNEIFNWFENKKSERNCWMHRKIYELTCARNW